MGELIPYTALSPSGRQNVKNAALATYEEICRYYTVLAGPQFVGYPNWERDTKLIAMNMAQKFGVSPLHIWAAFELVTPADDTPEAWAEDRFTTYNEAEIPYYN